MNRALRALLAFAALSASLGVASCAATKALAERRYTDDMLSCVDHAKTRAQADACAARVRAEWRTRDGGTP